MIVISQLRVDPLTFRLNTDGLFSFIRKIASNRQEEQAMLALGFELIYKSLGGAKRQDIPRQTMAQLIVDRIDLIPTFINREFPGYAASGLLKWIFKKDSDDVRQESDN